MLSESFLRDFFGMRRAAKSSSKVKQQCSNCRFSVRVHGGFIDCHRHAPGPRTTGSETDRYLHPDPDFPMLNSWDWCGDWSPEQGKTSEQSK